MIYFPANPLFKIESIADARCERIEDYSNVHRGGDKSALQNWDTLRMRLGEQYYDLTIGASTVIRLNFLRYVT